MPEKVIIFGKDTWPYTTAAREDYAKKGIEVEYVNVKASVENMNRMLKAGGGGREVPLIVAGGRTTVGFGGT